MKLHNFSNISFILLLCLYITSCSSSNNEDNQNTNSTGSLLTNMGITTPVKAVAIINASSYANNLNPCFILFYANNIITSIQSCSINTKNINSKSSFLYNPIEINGQEIHNTENIAYKVYNVKTNNAGYITQFTSQYDTGDEEDISTINCKYDNFDHLVKVISEEDDKDGYKSNETQTLFWNNGDLMNIEIEGIESENGKSDTWNFEISFSYDANSPKDSGTFYQYLIWDGAYEDIDSWDFIFYAGLFGCPSTHLPKSYMTNDNGIITNCINTYSLDTNGQIKTISETEKDNLIIYSFKYDYNLSTLKQPTSLPNIKTNKIFSR